MALRVLIVDDSASFLDAARIVLESEGAAVVGVACSADEGCRLAAELLPDVVLVDVALGGESGFELTRRLHGGDGPGPAVILISTHSQADFADLIAASPALGFVPKAELSIESLVRILALDPE